MMQMSVVTDSPVRSSSSDDFIAFLDAELDASSPNSSPDKEAENQDELESVRIKRRKFESVEETEGSTSEGIIERNLGNFDCFSSFFHYLCWEPESFSPHVKLGIIQESIHTPFLF
ncbi:hypothetical protein E2542_SST19120 [Spatholobus suberectus]|nr:hypothetical protein E2542_SST19120 [Spatholobus suberectus]